MTWLLKFKTTAQTICSFLYFRHFSDISVCLWLKFNHFSKQCTQNNMKVDFFISPFVYVEVKYTDTWSIFLTVKKNSLVPWKSLWPHRLYNQQMDHSNAIESTPIRLFILWPLNNCILYFINVLFISKIFTCYRLDKYTGDGWQK